MKKINLLEGLKLGVWILLIQLLLAGGSYLTACWRLKYDECSLSHGITWISHHPVFPNFILYFPIIAFIVGAFGELLLSIMPAWVKKIFDPSRQILAWFFVVLLILAFALWGMPDAIHILKLSR